MWYAWWLAALYVGTWAVCSLGLGWAVLLSARVHCGKRSGGVEVVVREQVDRQGRWRKGLTPGTCLYCCTGQDELKKKILLSTALRRSP
ncbi:hypothetical protein BDY21DRAFT_337257 [Lineolata rhizophorae]|uniref:Uncharacterized protein n=1 Tax=Lineolata rhizophorae TaxID=578093 RepID=A0A6A6P7V3_9PEZI|nr:hypothetical protein BDY21DRAFT_337257 [Lineolata rhizophorae]